MNDMRSVIVPKSDQINADDLIGGPIVITISSVEIRPGTEQPVSIRFDGDGGKPFKPCKSMCRIMVQCWGPDANQYTGRSMTLYRDPAVKWGGLEVGGIRISHMSHLKSTMTMALTTTKGSKKPFVVQPLTEPKPIAPRQTVAEWIANTLPTLLGACDTVEAVQKAQATKVYQAAFTRASEDERQAMIAQVAAVVEKIGGGWNAATAPEDDIFPGDLPSQDGEGDD